MKLQNVRSLLLSSLLLTVAAVAAPAAAHADPAAAPPDASATSSGSPAMQPTGETTGAEQAAAAAAPVAAEPRLAFGFNLPNGWIRDTFAGSFYIGLHRHHAVRANFARTNAEELLPLVVAHFERYPREGRILDASIGWVYFPRRLWDGFTFEAGVLLRDRDVRTNGDYDTSTVRSLTHAGRAMVGWSWRLNRHLFVAASVGLSVGREIGRETIEPDSFPRAEMPMTVAIDRRQVAPEFALRFGLAFGR